jgi:hypothetical protein
MSHGANKRVFPHPLFNEPSRRKVGSAPSTNRLTQLLMKAHTQRSGYLATSSATSRARLFSDIQAFINRNSIQMSTDTILIYLESRRKRNGGTLIDSSVHTVAGSIISMLASSEFSASFRPVQRAALVEYRKSLEVGGGTRPTQQALPISRQQMYALIKAAPAHLKAPLFIQWKTAARWDEIQRLTRTRLRLAGTNELLVDYNGNAKNSRFSDLRADMFVVIQHNPALPLFVSSHLQTLGQTARLTTLTTSQLDKWLRPLPTGTPNRHWTAHSVKRGALDHLASFLPSGQITATQLVAMARHKNRDHGTAINVPSQTLGYMSDPYLVTRAAGMDKATALL